MSLFIWEGNGTGTKSDFDDGRNWVDEAGTKYLEGRYPGSVEGVQDEVLFQNPLAKTAASPAAYNGSTDEKLLSLRIGPAYDGTIGSIGSPIELGVDQVTCNGAAAGAIYLRLGAVVPYTTDVLVVNGTSVNLDGNIGECRVTKGNVTIAATAVVDTLYVSYQTSILGDAACTIEAGATIDNMADQSGGLVTCHISSTSFDFRQSAGTWNQYGDVNSILAYGNGTINWIEGNLSSVTMFGAVTLSGADGSSPRHISDLVTAPGCVIDLDNGLGNIRVLNPIRYLGGDFTPSINSNWLQAGIRNIIGGIEFHVGNSGANPTASSDWLLIAPYDYIEILTLSDGALPTTSVNAAEDDSGTDAEGAAAAATNIREAFYNTPPAWTARTAIWGSQMPAGKPYLGVTITHSGVSDTVVTVIITRRRF